jgi:CRP-like cAMP-binding protein
MSTRSELDQIARELSEVETFRGLTEDECRLVAGFCRRRRFYRGEPIFEDNDEGDDLFIVRQGRVTVRLESVSPYYEMVISHLGEGQVFGEMALLGRERRSVTVVCSEPTEALQIDAAGLRGLFEERPRLGLLVVSNLARTLSDRLHQMNRRLLSAARVNQF